MPEVLENLIKSKHKNMIHKNQTSQATVSPCCACTKGTFYFVINGLN